MIARGTLALRPGRPAVDPSLEVRAAEQTQAELELKLDVIVDDIARLKRDPWFHQVKGDKVRRERGSVPTSR
jgi:hypothetical protein